MEQEIRAVVARYGYREVNLMLNDLMRSDYEYLKTLFGGKDVDKSVEVEVPQKKEKKSRGPKKQKADDTEIKNIIVTQDKEQELLSSTFFVTSPEQEVKTVSMSAEQSAFRDPKEVKKWQKEQEELRRKQNESEGIQLTQILTKENLRKWIEEEGKTYAWVAREKAGCPDTQVAATAQMMGIKSKITKKRGIAMGTHA